jgi:hypothetical protein
MRRQVDIDPAAADEVNELRQPRPDQPVIVLVADEQQRLKIAALVILPASSHD